MAFKPSSFLRIGNYMTSPQGFAFCVGRQEAKLLRLTIAVTQPGDRKRTGREKSIRAFAASLGCKNVFFFFFPRKAEWGNHNPHPLIRSPTSHFQ